MYELGYDNYKKITEDRASYWRQFFESARKETYDISENGFDITLIDDLKLKQGIVLSPYLTLFKKKFPQLLPEVEEDGGEKEIHKNGKQRIQIEEEDSKEGPLTIFDIEKEEERIYKGIDFPMWKEVFHYTKEKKRDRNYIKKISKRIRKLQESQGEYDQMTESFSNKDLNEKEERLKLLKDIINYSNALEQDTLEFVNLPAKWIGINIPKEQKENPYESMEIPRNQYECKMSPAYRFASSFGEVKNILIRTNPLIKKKNRKLDGLNMGIANETQEESGTNLEAISPANARITSALDQWSTTSDELIQSSRRLPINPNQDFFK